MSSAAIEIQANIRNLKPNNSAIGLKTPIEAWIEQGASNELCLVAAMVKYEMERLVEIPDEFLDYRLTLEQVGRAIDDLPRVSADEIQRHKTEKENLYAWARREIESLQQELARAVIRGIRPN